jgi:ADP-ribose pyrophosphatase YjhB (NUDIX family)
MKLNEYKRKKGEFYMNKFKEIRPIVLGVAIQDNKLLVSEGLDKIKNQTFYRCLGGGIEFLEKSSDALRREFLEEINADIIINDFLGVSENIFTYNGKNAHELVFYYLVDIDKKDYKNEYIVNDDNGQSKATWIDINDFKNGNKILYPEGMFKYII